MKNRKLDYKKQTLKQSLTFLPMFFLTILIGSLSILTSCSDDDGEDQQSLDDRSIKEYLENNEIEAKRTSSGLYYEVLESNSEGDTVKKNDILSIYYKITLLNGKEIDEVPKSSEEPKKFQVVDKSIVPKGIRMGCSLMKEGEIFRFYLPSRLAYGLYSYEDKIPSSAILIVEAEIAEILKENDQEALEKQVIEHYIDENEIADINEESGIYYKRTEEGEGDKPEEGDKVNVKYVGKYLDGTVFDKDEDKGLSFTIGTENIIEGFQNGVQLMQEKERATFIIPSNLAYWSSLQVFPEEIREDLETSELIPETLPPFSILIYEVELVEIEK